MMSLKTGLIPKFTELSVFLAFFASLVVLALHWAQAKVYGPMLYEVMLSDPRSFLYAAIILFGGIISAYYTFNFKQTPPHSVRRSMIAFAILIELVVAMGLLIGLAHEVTAFGVVLGMLNLVYALLLVILFGEKIFNESHFLSRNANPAEVFSSMLACLVVILGAHFLFALQWAMTLSIGVSYAIIFHQLIFGRRE